MGTDNCDLLRTTSNIDKRVTIVGERLRQNRDPIDAEEATLLLSATSSAMAPTTTPGSRSTRMANSLRDSDSDMTTAPCDSQSRLEFAELPATLSGVRKVHPERTPMLAPSSASSHLSVSRCESPGHMPTGFRP
jgi:hypothetical protein